jgi:hypothetical protein
MPEAGDTVVCAPDDGWWYHPKHVEQFPDKINCVTLHLVGYIYIYIYIYILECYTENQNTHILCSVLFPNTVSFMRFFGNISVHIILSHGVQKSYSACAGVIYLRQRETHRTKEIQNSKYSSSRHIRNHNETLTLVDSFCGVRHVVSVSLYVTNYYLLICHKYLSP